MFSSRRDSNQSIYLSTIFNAYTDQTLNQARGRDLTILLSLLGVYANAEKVVLAHAPALKRAQRGDVIAAIAAKDAQQAATAANGAKKCCGQSSP